MEAFIIPLIGMAINQVPAVVDFFNRHKNAGTTPTLEEVKALVATAETNSEKLNDEWKNS